MGTNPHNNYWKENQKIMHGYAQWYEQKALEKQVAKQLQYNSALPASRRGAFKQLESVYSQGSDGSGGGGAPRLSGIQDAKS